MKKQTLKIAKHALSLVLAFAVMAVSMFTAVLAFLRVLQLLKKALTPGDGMKTSRKQRHIGVGAILT